MKITSKVVWVLLGVGGHELLINVLKHKNDMHSVLTLVIQSSDTYIAAKV